jgi:hypothetical protein
MIVWALWHVTKADQYILVDLYMNETDARKAEVSWRGTAFVKSLRVIG